MNGATNNGANNQAVGAIEITSARTASHLVGNSSTTIGGTLTLNGVSVNSVSNVIVRNASSQNFTLQDTQGSGNRTMGIALGNATDNIINIDGTGNIAISSIISGASRKLTRGGSGTGVLTLSGINTYSGDTTISNGTLALSGAGSIANSPSIVIAGGATFDVTGLTTALTLASGQTLRATGTTTTGTITTSATKGLTLASNSPLQFTAFNGTTAPLTISGAGSVTLASGNIVTVTVSNGGTPLAAGTYTLINKGASGSVTGSAPTSLTVNGDGIAGGTTASLQITGAQLVLNVVAAAVPTITVTGGPLNFGNRAVGAISPEQTYTVAGSNLTADITVTAPSADFQVSKTTGTGFGSSVTFTQTGGTVTAQTVFVRFTPQSAGAKSGNVTNASTGATTQNVAVSGTGIACPTLFTVDDTGDTPDANPGDGVCDDGSTDQLCTLRAAIMEANALTACSPLTIDFSVTGTITLTNGQLPISHPNLTISGPGASQLTVTGNSASRVFQVNSTSTTSIGGLTITGGNGIGASDSGSGGGILSRGTLTLTGCVVTGNTTTGMTIHEGGGVFNAGSQLLTLTNCTVSNNTANFGGAGVASFGNLMVTGCTVANNTNTFTSDSGRGGGIEAYATTTITNSTISNNHIDNGTGDNAGGIWNCCGPMTIINSTITGNSAAGNSGAPSAGGLLQDACCGGSVTVLNSIIAGNTGTGGAVADVGGAFTSSGFNLIGDGTGSTGFTGTGDQVGTTATPINPRLSLLGNFGGLTQTHALLPGSPAINAGTSTGAPTSDQRGKSRFGTTDIGAFESQGFVLAVSGGTNQSTIVGTNFTNPLTLTVTANNTADNEPVNGGQVTFTPPGAGASCTFATNPATISGGAASSGTVTANATVGGPYNVAAGATGATAVNFSLTNTSSNTAPSFVTVATPSRQQGVAASNSTIATVTDAQTAPGSLTVTVTTANPSNGVTVSNIQNSGGTITADIVADCTASNAGFTLQVSDGSLTNTATLNVTVTANTPPTLTYSNANVFTGTTGTINPATGPSDNVGVNSIAVQSVMPSTAPGTITVNNATGVVTVPNNVPAGAYTVTIRATDNCGGANGTTDAVFTLTVGCINTLTVNNLGDGADATPGNGVCETATGNGICTLRAAIQESNALTTCSPLTINITATGTINLASELPYLEHPNLTVQGPGATQLTVTRNAAAMFGIFTVQSDVAVINDLTVSNGNATDLGGGIYGDKNLTINRCHITGNTAVRGGGVVSEGGTISINNSTISGNTATSAGGGVFNLGNEGTSQVTLTNCTISGNTVTAAGGAATAGGLANYAEMDGTAVINLVNCTIVGNTATSVTNAGGIFSGVEDNGSTANINLKNTILSGNGSTQALAGTDATITSQGNNLASDTAGGFLTGSGDLTNTNPLLAALANYGGSTNTYALLPGSPAINTGTSSGAPTNDQRGSSRVGAVDMGAFESQGFSLAIGSGSPQSAVVNTNFGAALKVNVTANNAGEPVDGGQITFTPPGMGASATVAGSPVTIAGGMATTGTVTANSITGSYNVAAGATGATGVNFALTNTCQTITVNNPGANTATVGTMFTATFTQTGGIGTTTFSTSSTLPNGVTLSGAGVLSGTPTQSGSFPITVTATDSNLCTGASVGYTLTVSCPTITVNPSSLPNGTVGTAYNQIITPSGGSSANYTYSSTGTLPPGLTLSPGPSATGTLSGNPTASGNYNFTIIATDANGCTGNRAYAVTINQAPAITSAATTTFTVNIAGSFTVTTSGVPTVTSITRSGVLPAGVSFTDNGNGTATLSGTPGVGTNGMYPLTLTASNGIAPNAVQNFTLVVSGLVCPSTLTVNDLGDAADANPGDGLCATGGGVCTLRAAIEEANAITACTPLTINFSVTGTINLATALPNLNHPNLTITGPGASQIDVHRNVVTAFRIFTVNSGKTVNISGLTISNGNADDGGGIQNSGTLTVMGCVFANNRGSSNGGGGIANIGILTVDQSTFSNNIATFFGGGLLQIDGGTANVSNSTFSGNSGPFGGGAGNQGIARVALMTFTNCTFSGNTTTSRGGALGNYSSGVSSTLNLVNCTVANNSSPTGNGIDNGLNSGGPSIVNLKNTILANAASNVTGYGGAVYNSQGNNISTDGTGNLTQPTDQPNTNPLLAPLANNGGLTQTHLLQPGSPAIDKGGAAAGVTTDQRGQARPFDIPGVVNAAGGNASDIGAVEVQCAAISLAGLPGGADGMPYASGNIAGGGTAPYTLSVTAGSLPPGITISGNGLTGTPTQTGIYSFTLSAQDAYGCTGSQSYTVNVGCPTTTLSPATLPNATVNTAYPQTISASPALAYTFAVTNGLLPTGLTLNSNGSFSGAPTQSGVFNFRVTAGFGGCSAFADYTLLVNCPTVTLSPSSLPGGTLGTAYNQSVTASPAGAYFYSVTSGALPTGLTLNGATGAITGTPVIAGTFNFTVTASQGACSTARSYTVNVTCQSVAITSTTTLTTTAGSAYSHAISVNPAGNYTFTLTQGNLPSGLTLNPITGVISGLPTVVGTVSFKIGVQLPNSCVTEQTYTMNVTCPPTVTVSPTTLPNGTTGTAYNQTLSASPAGGNYVYTVSAGSLPTGLNLNPATGVLSGTPSANGTFNFTITATGFGTCPGSRAYTVVIGGGGCPTITLPASLPGGSAGQLYNQSVAASPAGSYGYTVAGNLPPGVTLYGSLGLLLGYPTANGTYNFSVTATGANSCSATQSYSVVIGAGSSLATVNDFSGDRRSDFVLWREAQTQWLIVDGATNAVQTAQWGQAGDRSVAGDFDGDGKADLAGFGKDGHWRVKFSGGGTLDKVWGLGSDVPVPGDYDGDGKTDLAVWRGAETIWYILRSSDGQTQTVAWGSSLAPYNDLAVPGDYDGDGKTDIAVFRQAFGKDGGKDGGHWYIRRSSDGKVVTKAWGLGTDVPVPADFDGDGKTDIAVWRGSEGNWYIINSSTGTTDAKFWGAGYGPYFDVPAVGDYDGDGKADPTVWRKSDNRWYVLQSSDGAARTVTQGRAGDAPVVAQPRQ